jgi:hypothetical protein
MDDGEIILDSAAQDSIGPQTEQEASYWAVVVDESAPPPPELHEFSTFVLLVDFLRDVYKNRKGVWVLPFYGDALNTTEGIDGSSLRFLVDVTGTRSPLFDTEVQPEIQPPGFYSPAGDDYVDPETLFPEKKQSKHKVFKPKKPDFDDSSDLDHGFDAGGKF